MEFINLSIIEKIKIDHDGTRTRNLLIRSQTPYPLGHTASHIYDGIYCNLLY